MFIALLSCEQKSTRNTAQNIIIPEKQISRADTLDLLLKQAGLENRNVFMVLGFTGCGGCKLFEKYHSDPGVKAILNKYFIITYIDYKKTRGGKELYARYASTAAPSWTIFDPDGKVLVNSDAPVPGIKDTKANIGYPSGKMEIGYYLNALKLAAPAIKNSECDFLADRLALFSRPL
jgi:thioredoxin-related protein